MAPHASRPDPDKLQSALHASCDALMTLQSIELEGTDVKADHGVVNSHRIQAIQFLRSAIAKLRLARAEEMSMFGWGFVLRADRPQTSRREPSNAQVKPRRTA